MKKNYYKLLFISFFLLLVFPISVSADDGYQIENYDVDIKVNENNVLNITETIDVNFTLSSHGIIRKIPYKNTYHRKDNEIQTKAIIENVNVSEPFSMYKENNNVNLKIGDKYETIIGPKRYVIKYNYDVGDDNLDDFDDLYFNIIGTEWDTEIKNVTFKIEMPKEFDKTLINFTVGRYGATYHEDVIYNISNNTIAGYVKPGLYGNALERNEGLTVRIELEEGYFVNERIVFDPTKIIVYGLLSTSVLIISFAILIFKKYGYREKSLIVPEYIVPDNLTPAEIGYLYNGHTKNEQIISLIIYFANKGYLQIIEENKKNFSFKKLKDIDLDEPNYAKTTFNEANKEGVVWLLRRNYKINFILLYQSQ